MKRIDPRIIPHVRAIAAMLTQLKIIDVGLGPVLRHQDQLMFRAVKRPHPAIGFILDAQIFKVGADRPGRREEFIEMTPIHADKMDGTILTVRH